MQKLGLNTLFKLSLILLAFEAYSITEGHSALHMSILELQAKVYTLLFKQRNCPSNVTEAVIPCVSHAITAVNETGTEVEQCKAIVASMKRCVLNGVIACAHEPILQLLTFDNFNFLIPEDMCTSTDWAKAVHLKNLTAETSVAFLFGK